MASYTVTGISLSTGITLFICPSLWKDNEAAAIREVMASAKNNFKEPFQLVVTKSSSR